MSDIFERLMQMDRDLQRERATPLPEAIIERMREAAPRFTGACPFVFGDVVTARTGGFIIASAVGVPALVIGADDTIGFDWGGERGTPSHGARLNMRVLYYETDHDAIVARWEDSANYELFSEYQARQRGGDDGAEI